MIRCGTKDAAKLLFIQVEFLAGECFLTASTSNICALQRCLIKLVSAS
jgi:hypothetical protein